MTACRNLCNAAQAQSFFFFFNDTATTEIYTLSLHDALPISPISWWRWSWAASRSWSGSSGRGAARDRKSTRLNSSHSQISYAVFCLKKKNIICNAHNSTAEHEQHITAIILSLLIIYEDHYDS